MRNVPGHYTSEHAFGCPSVSVRHWSRPLERARNGHASGMRGLILDLDFALQGIAPIQFLLAITEGIYGAVGQFAERNQ
jgi:hypothetical protein